MHKKIFLILLTLISLALSVNFAYADLEIPGKEILKEVSIHSDSFQDTKNVSISDARNFGGNLLSIARLVVAGFALIYIVIIGANLIVSSDDEGLLLSKKNSFFIQELLLFFLIFLMLCIVFLCEQTIEILVREPGRMYRVNRLFGIFQEFSVQIILFLASLAF